MDKKPRPEKETDYYENIWALERQVGSLRAGLDECRRQCARQAEEIQKLLELS